MLLKLFRSIAIGLIVAGLLLVAMPSLRQFNKLTAPQFDSTDETPATYNQAVRRAAPAVVNVYNRGLNSSSHNQLEIRTLGSGVIMDERGYIITNKHVINDADQIIVALQDGRVFADFVADIVHRRDISMNSDGAAFKLSSLSFAPIVSTRRI